jgi:hypothetical protein
MLVAYGELSTLIYSKPLEGTHAPEGVLFPLDNSFLRD